VIIYLKQLKDVEIIDHRGTEDKTIRIVEYDGSPHGGLTEIIIPATSYEMLEAEIVERWLERKKQL
jgi:hypothetical protein